MKKIGFVDYYISEWHANNYPIWISKVNEELGEDFRVSYVWAERDVSPVDNRSTDEWCKAFGTERCESIAELCEKSDYIIILAPSNPEKHLPYVKEVFHFGKPCYVDKTFADSLSEAKEIFALGEKYSTPFFSTSALRYASELEELEVTNYFGTAGGGSSIGEYIIHQSEMIVKKLGTGAESLVVTKENNNYSVHITYSDGREGEMLYSPGIPFSVKADRESDHTLIKSDFFPEEIRDILLFFKNGTLCFGGEETLEAIALRDGVLAGCEALGKKITL